MLRSQLMKAEDCISNLPLSDEQKGAAASAITAARNSPSRSSIERVLDRLQKIIGSVGTIASTVEPLSKIVQSLKTLGGFS